MKRLLAAAGILGFVLAVPGVALGYWLASDSGQVQAQAGVLPPGRAPVTVAVHRHTVTLRVPVASAAVSQYLVRRYAGTTVVASLRCRTRCVERQVPDGVWRYTATPVRGRWSGPESAPGPRLRIDTTAPRVRVTTPEATNDRTPVLAGTAGRAPGDRAVVTVRLSYRSTVLLTRKVTVRGGHWRFTAPKLAVQRRYTVLVRQADRAGNVGTARGHFVIDTIAPSVWLAPPADPARRLGGLAGTATASATSSADRPTITVQFHAGGRLVRTVTTTRAGRRFTVPTSGLATGRYQVRALQRDAAGNLGISNARTIRVDATAPVLTLDVPAFVRTSPVLRGHAGTADGDRPRVRVRVLDGDRLVLQRRVAAPAGDWRLALPALPPNREYTVQVSQFDIAGNLGQVADAFVLDTIAPVPTMALAGDQLVGTAGTATASATTAPDRASVTVLSYRGTSATGRPVRVQQVPVVDGKFALDRPAVTGSPITVVVQQQDAAGNLGRSQPLRLDPGTPPSSPPPPSSSPSPSATG